MGNVRYVNGEDNQQSGWTSQAVVNTTLDLISRNVEEGDRWNKEKTSIREKFFLTQAELQIIIRLKKKTHNDL